jgi:tRNA U55 pseudouridine synthase TruB
MISLRRLEVGDMQLNQESVTIEDALGSLIKKILPCDVMCQDMDKVILNPEDAKKIRNGLSIDYNAPLKNNRLVRIYTESKIFIGIGEVSENFKLLPKRLLSTN